MTRIVWTEQKKERLKSLYADNRSADIADMLGVKLSAVYNMAFKLGLKKNIEVLRQLSIANADHPAKIATRFEVGNVSWNYNLKGDRFKKRMPKESYKRMQQTHFAKNHKPMNTKPVGTISLRGKSKAKPYLYIKIADSNWQLLQRHVWEQHFGPIPKGHVVVFKDGDFKNCNINNLEVISKKENMARNSIMNYPPEVREVLVITRSIKIKIKKLTKK
jgi:hypothetical protein